MRAVEATAPRQRPSCLKSRSSRSHDEPHRGGLALDFLFTLLGSPPLSVLPFIFISAQNFRQTDRHAHCYAIDIHTRSHKSSPALLFTLSHAPFTIHDVGTHSTVFPSLGFSGGILLSVVVLAYVVALIEFSQRSAYSKSVSIQRLVASCSTLSRPQYTRTAVLLYSTSIPFHSALVDEHILSRQRVCSRHGS